MNPKLRKLLDDKKKQAEAFESEVIKGIKVLRGKPGPQGKSGKDGVDGKSPSVPALINEVLSQIPIPKDGENGKDSEVPGPKGDRGPMGPMPNHRWKKTSLQFEQPDGSWGTLVQLIGEKGEKGDVPEHEVSGLKIRFRKPNGKWGEYLDLTSVVNIALGAIKRQSGGSHGGPVSLLMLSDTPDTYNGANGYFLKVQGNQIVFSPGSSGGGTVDSVVAGNNIDVDAADPANPIVGVKNTIADSIDVASVKVEERQLLDDTGGIVLDWTTGVLRIRNTANGEIVVLDTSLITAGRNIQIQDMDGVIALLENIASGTITARADDIDFSGGSDGDVLTVQADGSLALETPSGGGSGTVDSIVAGNNIDVDATDPANPVVSVETLTLADISDVTASVTELNYIDGVTSAIQGQIDGKQAVDSDLTAIAGLTPSNDDIIQRKAGSWINRTMAQLKSDLGLVKADVGLGNVDNTSDANKPVSTATQTALDAKLDDSQLDTDGTLAANSDAKIASQKAVKTYVDSIAQGLDIKASVRVATTANISLTGEQTIDGVSVVTGDRVLVKDQSTGANNGIYIVSTGAWSRATDADSSSEVTSGLFTFVSEGTTNADSGWVLTTNDPITLGSTSLAFSQFSGAGQITAGNALTKTGNTLDVAVDNSSIEISGDALRVKAAGITSPMLAGSIDATKIADGSVTSTEFQYIGGLTSDAQTQLDAKVAKSTYDAHTVLYATTDNTPVALTVGEQTVVGRATGGNISAIAIDPDLSSVSANDDTIPSAKATKAMGDLKLPLAGGTMTGPITLAENASIALDPAGSADGKYSGITVTGIAGYTQAFGDLVYLDPTDSRWEAVDANAASGADGDARGMLAMVVSAGTDGNACTLLLQGIIRADANFPAFTVNNPIYVSETAGDVTQTQPTTTDAVIRIIGAALTADEMYFNPDWTYTTHV